MAASGQVSSEAAAAADLQAASGVRPARDLRATMDEQTANIEAQTDQAGMQLPDAAQVSDEAQQIAQEALAPDAGKQAAALPADGKPAPADLPVSDAAGAARNPKAAQGWPAVDGEQTAMGGTDDQGLRIPDGVDSDPAASPASPAIASAGPDQQEAEPGLQADGLAPRLSTLGQAPELADAEGPPGAESDALADVLQRARQKAGGATSPSDSAA